MGSHLYGTETEDSDIDYMGIMIAPEDYYFGLYKIDEIDLSVESKLDTGKNDENAIDRKFYELKNFVNLSLKNNPNILELLYADDKSIIFKNVYYDILQKSRDLFLSKKEIYDRFISYANSQKHKMIIKLENYEQLAAALEFFEKQNPNEYIVMFRDDPQVKKFFVEKGSHFIIGDLNFQKHMMVKKVVNIIKERLSKITNRNELVLKHGYDTKFASHLIRLLSEGETLLKTGKLEFPLPNADFILDVKNGKYELEELLSIADDYEDSLKTAYDDSSLPEEPRFDEVNGLITDMIRSFFWHRWRQ